MNFTGSGTPATIGQTEAVIPHATLHNLCQSVTLGPITLPGGLTVGPFTSVTKAGAGTHGDVTATNLVTDTSTLSADKADFTNFRVGQDLGTFTDKSNLNIPVARGTGPDVVTIPAAVGTFGQTAATVTITTLRSSGTATSALSFTVPDLTVGFDSTGKGC